MKYHFTLALLILAAVFCITPALGADKYLGGAPEISAYLSGVNEFSPGQDATITVVIQNSGTSAVVFTNQGTLTPADVPTTAKLVTVGLSSGGCPDQHHDRLAEPGRYPKPGDNNREFCSKDHLGRDARRIRPPLTIHNQYLSNSLANQPTSETLQ